MTVRQQIQLIPSALSKTLEKGRAEIGAVARKIRWGDGPVLVSAAGQCLDLALKSSSVFEAYPGWPVVAHAAEVFQTYALPLLKPHSVLLLISAGENHSESEELARLAGQRGCIVLVLADSAENPLMKHAHHPLLIAPEIEPGSPAMMACLQAALNLFALEAAQALKRPEPQWADIKEELTQLPQKIEWLFTQLAPLVRSFAAEIAQHSSLKIFGSGLYEYPAFRAAHQFQSRGNLRAFPYEMSEFLNSGVQLQEPGVAALFVSGSHSKLKKVAHRCADTMREKAARVLCVTDGNDRELSAAADLGLLIPSLHELPSSTMALFMLEWIVSETTRRGKA
jgi:fructoselysine-6-P-deglycase FrlB-like protein